MTLANLYEKLTSIPLFRGMSGEELAVVSDRVNLRWVSVGPEQTFIQCNEPCNHLAVLMEGEMKRITYHDGNTYVVTEKLSGIHIFELEQLYGLTCRYRSDYVTITSCKMLLISKDDVRKTLMNISIFRINMMNLLSAKYCKLLDSKEYCTYDLKEQIMHFGAEEPLTVKIRMVDLGRYLGAARNTISHVLHEMEREGKLSLRPNLIIYNRD